MLGRRLLGFTFQRKKHEDQIVMITGEQCEHMQPVRQDVGPGLGTQAFSRIPLSDLARNFMSLLCRETLVDIHLADMERNA